LIWFVQAIPLFVFFFQAEDGIRDRNVTGVQTCALPIWRVSVSCMVAFHASRATGFVSDGPSTSGRWVRGSTHSVVAVTATCAMKIGRASCRERGGVCAGGQTRRRGRHRGGAGSEQQGST